MSIRKTLDKLKGAKSSKKITTFSSFEKFIPKLIETIQPNYILEFGPGISTKAFLKYSSANILSFETDSQWFKKYKDEIKDSRLSLKLKDPDWDLDEVREENVKFDLVFVDGGDRVKELKFCKQVITPTGVVLLHDAHREDYFEGIIDYKYIFFIERHSCLLIENENIYSDLKKRITPDYSCKCKYCSTEERRSYFSQFIGKDRDCLMYNPENKI